jgi:hypothetical protein
MGEQDLRMTSRVIRSRGAVRAVLAFAVVALVLGSRIVAGQGGAQTRDVFPALTVPAARLPEGCRLTPPDEKPPSDPASSFFRTLRFPANPWVGRDHQRVALIRRSIDGPAVLPDGPPLSPAESAALSATWSDHVVDAYHASYSMGDAVTVVLGVRFDDETRATPEAPGGKRSLVRAASTRVVIGSTVAVVHSPGRNPCYDAVAAYVRALK